MKNSIYPLLIFSVTCYMGYAQQSVEIYPKKDALIDSYDDNTNFGNNTNFRCLRDEGSNNVTIRSLIEFDLSEIPVGAMITDATLFLYGLNHIMSDPTESYLERIDEFWDESTVDWNSQPTLAGTTPVTLNDATGSTEDYELDVTSDVQDMVKNPERNFGFMLKLQNEESSYASLDFASSDNSNVSKRPKLEITYEYPKRFASLRLELDGSYYIAYNGELLFKYEEKYLAGLLSFKIYDEFHTVVYDNTDVPISKKSGANWVYINLSDDDQLSTDNFYILEVKDENGRFSYLRFLMAGEDTDTDNSTVRMKIDHLINLPK